MIGKPFQPGQSGNPNGRPKTKPFKEALRKVIDAAGDDDTALMRAASALLAKAQEGDVQAIKELADRLDGKVSQPIAGDEENPIRVAISRIELVALKPNDNGTDSTPA